MRKRKRKENPKGLIIFLILGILFTTALNFSDEIKKFIYTYAFPTPSYNLGEIPEYSGKSFVYVNENIPAFTEEEISTESKEEYSELDFLGRCGRAFAILDQDLMPTEERGSIGMIKPSGWHTIKYDIVDGKYLYNRCHLIGFQLSGENANSKNLITCTRETNTGAMLDFENEVARYIKETNNHVMYRVTPIFEGTNLVAKGIEMEALSVEDKGEGIKFHVYIYNVQKGIEINYETGESELIS